MARCAGGGREGTGEAQPAPERGGAGRAREGRADRGAEVGPRDWKPAANRPDPIAFLEEQAGSRVPELVPIRYGRMLASPFTFYRGAALIMAADLAGTPQSAINVQLCGDAHLSNFGVFGSPERKLMFDINDFDETLPGPWEWDVKRLAASLEVAGRELGFAPADRREIVTACVAEYRGQMRTAAEMTTLDAWYDHVDADRIMDWILGEVSGGASRQEGGEGGGRGRRQGAGARPPARVQEAGRRRSRASCGSSRTRR